MPPRTSTGWWVRTSTPRTPPSRPRGSATRNLMPSPERPTSCRRARTCCDAWPACSPWTTRMRRRWPCSIRGPGAGRSRPSRRWSCRKPSCPSWPRPRPRPGPSRPGSPRPRGFRRARPSWWGAATRWPRRWGRACTPPARCAMSSARPSRCARRRASRARTLRCSWNAILTPTPTRGSSRTLGSSPAGRSGGGATSSVRWSSRQNGTAGATRTTCCARRRKDSRPGRTA